MCCNRGGTATAVSYPREVLMPDGVTKTTVTSAADERVQRERFRQKQRSAAGQGEGYTVAK